MAKVKALFSGSDQLQVAKFSDNLISVLKEIYSNRVEATLSPNKVEGEVEDLDRLEMLDKFVDAILCEAEWLLSELAYIKVEATVGEAKKELAKVKQSLDKAIDELTSLSPNIDRLFSTEEAPELLVDEMIRYRDAFLDRRENITGLIDKRSRGSKTKDAMDEMTIRVIRVLSEFGVEPAATANRELRQAAAAKGKDRYESIAVSVLTAISTDLQIPGSAEGWRNRLSRLKPASSRIR